MTRKPRSHPLPDWLRDLPAAIDQEAQLLPAPADGQTPAFWRGPHTMQLARAASVLFRRASMQAEELPFPGPWTMMLDTLITHGGDGPWSPDAGPRADLLSPDWAAALAREIADAALDKDTVKDCAGALRHVTGFPAATLRPLAGPFTAATTASAYAVALFRRAFTSVEAENRLKSILATWHACDLNFWADHGGWPWKPLIIDPQIMFVAREKIAHRLGEPAPAAGRA